MAADEEAALIAVVGRGYPAQLPPRAVEAFPWLDEFYEHPTLLRRAHVLTPRRRSQLHSGRALRTARHMRRPYRWRQMRRLARRAKFGPHGWLRTP